MLYKSKSNHSLLKNKDLSFMHLNTLSNFLENQQHVTQNITKEIRNQINISKKNEKIVDKTIVKINQQAQDLVRKYEQEKEKNEKLQFLVKHIQGEIYKAKVDKANELKNKIETDRLEEFTLILKGKEKELQKICEKTNNSSYQLSKKLDIIRALRSERTIVSQLLDKIQRQLCNLEHCYKVLVIQRTVGEQECHSKAEDFSRLEVSANKQLEKAMSNQHAHLQKQNLPETKIAQDHKQTNRSSYIIPAIVASTKIQGNSSQSEFNKDKQKQKDKKNKIENDLIKIECEKKVKIILNDLGLSSVKELPQSIQVLQNFNSQKLSQVTRLQEQIQQAESTILQLKRKRKVKKSKVSHKKIHVIRIQEWKKAVEQIKINRIQTNQFKQICKILFQRIKQQTNDQQLQRDFFNQEEQIIFYMGFLQQFFEKSYLEGKAHTSTHKKNVIAEKRLTSLLNNPHFERNNNSIFEEQDLLDFAKKNLQKIQSNNQKV